MINRKKRPSPEVATASLPDIIFMLLFFFMTVTVLRTASSKLILDLPATEHSAEIDHTESEYNIYVGLDEKENTKMQINDYIVTPTQLDNTLRNISSPLTPFEKMQLHIYLRVDKTVKMKDVFDVKLMLRKHGLRKINYVVANKVN